MKKTKLIIIGMIMLSTLALANYSVKQGDNLYSIAKKYNTTVKNLKSTNNLKSNKLSINQKLKINKKKTNKTHKTLTNKLSDNIVFFAHKSKKTVNNSISSLVNTAKKWIGTRYRFGGTTKRGVDCSAFVKNVYKKHGKSLPRTASSQASVGKHISKNNLKKGDLVFFKGTYKRGISHVGIFLGNNKFIHASSGAHKVIISSLNKAYYHKHYAGARRVV